MSRRYLVKVHKYLHVSLTCILGLIMNYCRSSWPNAYAYQMVKLLYKDFEPIVYLNCPAHNAMHPHYPIAFCWSVLHLYFLYLMLHRLFFEFYSWKNLLRTNCIAICKDKYLKARRHGGYLLLWFLCCLCFCDFLGFDGPQAKGFWRRFLSY